MKEILGKNLKLFFDLMDKNCDSAEITYAGNRYEVWEISDELHKEMCDMTEEQFVELAREDVWWRSSDRSVIKSVPNTEFIVSGDKMIGWYTRDTDENFQYAKLTDYLCYGIGVSQPRNVCACAMDLARFNDMTMGELFSKFEG